MNNISYTHNDDKTNNELKMPYDEILRNRDSADEAGLDGAKCSTMSSFSPQVCMPSLNIQDAFTMTYCPPPQRMNVGNNQFSQMRNDVHNSNSSALSEIKEAQIEHSSRPSLQERDHLHIRLLIDQLVTNNNQRMTPLLRFLLILQQQLLLLFGQATVPPLVKAAKELKSEHHCSGFNQISSEYRQTETRYGRGVEYDT